MDTTYEPTHKRVLRDGQVSRGPARWFRLADAAMRNPSGHSGKLFFARAALAERLRNEYPKIKGPNAHWHNVWNPDFYRNNGVPRVKRVVNYYTCSLFCTAMVVQLDTGITVYEKLVDYLAENGDVAPGKPKRKARCQFCGSAVK